MNGRRKLVGFFIGFIATAVSVYFIADAWRDQDLGAFATRRAAASVGACTAFYIAGVLLSALAWKQLLGGMGVPKRWREVAGIVSITQIGKYLPGNIAQHVARAGLAIERGIGPAVFLATVTIEMALLIVASVLVGFGSLVAADALGMLAVLGRTQALLAIFASALVALTIALVLRRHGWLWLTRCAPSIAQALRGRPLPDASSIGRALLLYALVYLVFGGGIVLMAQLLEPGVAQHGWLLVASFALAWVVGFVTPGAPAGLGVREGVMLLILGTAYRTADSGAIVLALRLATTLGDVLLMPMGWLLMRVPMAAAAAADGPR